MAMVHQLIDDFRRLRHDARPAYRPGRADHARLRRKLLRKQIGFAVVVLGVAVASFDVLRQVVGATV
jgi:hypothetical protein